ncbi:MAG: glycosyltransferase, partial [bacterium]
MHNNKLNILEINFSRAWGGLEMQMPIIAQGLKKLGHNVTVVCPKLSPAEKAAGQYGLKIINLENKIKYLDLFAVWKLKNIIKENKIDIVHSHMAKDLWMIVPAARMAGCKKIYFTRHIESHYRKKDIFHFILHRSLTGAVAITDAVKKSLIDTTHIVPERIEVIYCGVNIGKVKQKSLPRPSWNSNKGRGLSENILRKEYKISEDCLLIGTIGRLQEGKGQEYILRAAPAILKKFPELKIFLV